MATTVARLQAVLSADTRDFDKAMDTSVFRLGNLAKAGVAAAGAAGIPGLPYGLKTGVDEMLKHQQVAAQTEAVLKSTGGAANVSAKQVEGYATALMRKSGVDDEAIQSGENLLLTFTNIRNETGKGNQIFKQ